MVNPTNWRQQLTDLGGYENELVGVPAGAVRKMVDEIERLRADQDQLRSNFLRCSRLREIEQTAFVSVSKSNELLAAELKNIADANPKKWDAPYNDTATFQEWAQARARLAIAKTP